MARSLTNEGTSNAAFAPLDWGLLAGTSLIWGASFLFIANGLEAFRPETVGWLRVTLGFLTLSCIPAARGTIDPHDRPRVALLGLTWMAIPLTLFPFAEQHLSSAIAGMLNGAMPMMSALIASLMLRRHPPRAALIGLGIGFAGVILIALPSLGEGSASVGAVVMILVALVGYAVSTNLSIPLTQKYGSLVVQRAIQFAGALYTLPFGAAGLRHADPSRSAVVSLAVLGIAGTGIAFALAGRLSSRVGAVRMSIITYVMPVISLGLGVWFRDDHVEAVALGGIPLVLVGAYVTSTATRRGR